MLRTIF